MIRRFRAPDPALVFAGVAASGLVGLVFGWIGVSGTLDVSSQVAYTVSGGIGGLALVITGAAFLVVHLGRWQAEREDAALDRVMIAMATLAEAARQHGPAVVTAPTRRRPRSVALASADAGAAPDEKKG
jgi:hypothetical protein